MTFPEEDLTCPTKDELPRLVNAGGTTRVLKQHQRQQAAGFGLVGKHLDEHPSKADRFRAQVGSRQGLGAGSEVALVEDQVNDRQHSRQSLGKRGRRGHRDRDHGFSDLPFSAHQPLRDRRFALEEGSGDLPCREAAQRAEGQAHLGLAGERGMATREHQREPVVGISVHICVVRNRFRALLHRLSFLLEEGDLVGVSPLTT